MEEATVAWKVYFSFQGRRVHAIHLHVLYMHIGLLLC